MDSAKWHDPSEEDREEDYLLTGEELKLFQSVAARFQFPRCGQARPLVLSERVDAKNGFTTWKRPHCPQECCTMHNQISVNGLQISVGSIGQQHSGVW